MTDWLMVIITFIYVVATIFICVANFKSASTTRQQLEESREQYEETKRLSLMPFIIFEKISINNCDNKIGFGLISGSSELSKLYKIFKIKNIGLGTAKNITYTLTNSTDSYYRGDFFTKGMSSGDDYNIGITFYYPKEPLAAPKLALDLAYEDLLNNSYTQRVEFIFNYDKSKSLNLESIITNPPVLNKGDDDGNNV